MLEFTWIVRSKCGIKELRVVSLLFAGFQSHFDFILKDDKEGGKF